MSEITRTMRIVESRIGTLKQRVQDEASDLVIRTLQEIMRGWLERNPGRTIRFLDAMGIDGFLVNKIGRKDRDDDWLEYVDPDEDPTDYSDLLAAEQWYKRVADEAMIAVCDVTATTPEIEDNPHTEQPFVEFAAEQPCSSATGEGPCGPNCVPCKARSLLSRAGPPAGPPHSPHGDQRS